MATNNKAAYEAKRIRSLLAGNPLPTFSELVEMVIAANREYRLVKREDIVRAVAGKMGYSVDKSISGAVSVELARLAKKDKVVQAKQHGYWCIY